MKLRPIQVVAGVVVWVLFVLATIAGLFTGLGALVLSLVWKSKAKSLQRYASNLIHSSDRTAAAFLGYSGDRTVSKECGLELLTGQPSKFCSCLCKALDKVDNQHCIKEAS